MFSLLMFYLYSLGEDFLFVLDLPLLLTLQPATTETQSITALGGVYMTPGRLSPRSEFTPVPSHGSIFVYMIPKCYAGASHPGSRTGARISLRYEISQRYHVNAKRPPISV